MRIALVCDEYPPGPHGGVGTFNGDLADGLVAAGCEVDVIIAELNGPRHWAKPGVELPATGPRLHPVSLRAPQWMRWRPGALWLRWRLRNFVRRLHRQRRYDLVESIDNGGLLAFGGPPGIPHVVRLHGSSYLFDRELGSKTTDPFTHKLEYRTLKNADFLVGVSRDIAERELRLGGFTRSADEVIYNAVDTDFFQPDPSVAAEEGHIVFANTIHSRKGVHELCLAMNTVMARYPQTRLTMIGKHMVPDEQGRTMREALLNLVQPEFRDRVHFTGRLTYRSEVRDLMKRAHLCCYPSKLEGFGIAPVEAMALGKPTIYSRTGPGAEVIEDGVSGLLCDPLDPADIAEKICTVFADRALADRLGASARRRAVEKFGQAQWIERNLAFYRRCLSARG